MPHRPRPSQAFVSPLWPSQPSRFSFCRDLSTLSRHLRTNFSSSHPRLRRACMLSHDTKEDDVTTAAPTSSPNQYGAVSPQPPSDETTPTARSDHSTDPHQTDKRLWIAAGALVALFAVGSVAAASGAFNADTLVSLAAWFETLGPSAIFLYGGIYFLLELVAVPALPLTLGSGYLFGLTKGTVAVSVASTLAAAASFLIARYGLRDAISDLATRYPRFRAMDRAIGKQGFKFVFLLRLSPLLPFAISNYLYGLTSVNFPEYVLGSWLGMLPGSIAYVSAGAAVSALTDLDAGNSEINPILLLIGVVATVGALTFIGKIAAESVNSVEEEEIAHGN